ncbi:MAG: hypothetical protein OXB99_00405 [Acidimicrobiaceae bacterium]|nr:hypothetical protein [Acidimicrobiaceae bacterium]
MRKLAAVYLKLVAAAVVIHFCVWPFYGPGDSPEEPSNPDVWLVLDWFMAAALAVTILSLWRWPNQNHRGDRAMRIFAAAVTIAFVPNWFAAMASGTDNPTIWHLIDTALPILLWLEARRLWQQTG